MKRLTNNRGESLYTIREIIYLIKYEIFIVKSFNETPTTKAIIKGLTYFKKVLEFSIPNICTEIKKGE